MNAYYLRIFCTGLLCLAINELCYSQTSSCTNADFESGSFSGWIGTTGMCCPINSTTNGIVPGRHTIMTGGTDPQTNNLLSCVAPGGQYSVRLGNDLSGGQAEQLKYTFTVTPQTQLFIYRYAVVLEDPGHSPADQPRFQITVADQNGTIDYTCGYYNVVAGNNLQGFNNYGMVRWRNWTTVGIDLTSKMGSTITITFSTGDCGWGGHFGYAYIDCMCYPFNVEAEYCPGGLYANLSAPPGFASYLWSTGQTSTSIIINNPNIGDTVSVTMTSVTGCQVTLHTVLKESIVASSFSLSDSCYNSTQFIDSSYIVTGTPIAGWIWDFGDGTSSSLQNPVHQYSQPGTYLVTLYVVNQGGCHDSTTQLITLHNKPSASFSGISVCSGTSTPFFNQSTIASPDSITQYLWDFGDGSSASSIISPSHTFINPGTYPVSLIATSNNGCTDTSTLSFSTLPSSTAGFFTQSLCNNTVVHFTDTSTPFNGSITSWQWNFGDSSAFSGQQNPVHQYPSSGIYMAYLTVITDSVCSSTDSVQVVVLNNPMAAFSYGQICEKSEASFFDNSSLTGSTIINWQWNFGDGSPASNLKDPTHIYNIAGSYNVSLIVTASNGCTDTVQHTITVLNTPVASFTNNSVCPGSATLFSDQSTISGSTLSLYIWNFGDGSSMSYGANPQHIYNSAGTYTITHIVVAANGCRDTVILPVQTNPIPVPVFNAGSVCQYSEITFNSNSVISSGNIDSTIWDYGDGSAIGNGDISAHIYTAPGYFNVTLTVISDNGCVNSTSDQVYVNEIPQATFTFSNACAGSFVEFINLTPVTPSINNLIWNTGDNNIYTSGDTVVNQYLIDATYTVSLVVTSDSGCTDTSSQNLIIFPLPEIHYTITGVPCENDTLRLRNLSASPSGIINSQWYLSTGNILSGNTVYHSFQSGINHFTLIVTDANQCTSTLTDSIIIHENPLVNITTENVCEGIASTFTANVSCPDSLSSVLWDYGDTTSDSQLNTTHLFTNYGSYTTTFYAVSIVGCSTEINSTVLVHPNPIADFSTGTTCEKAPVSFINLSSVASGTLQSSLWDFGDDSPPSVEYDIEHSYQLPGIYPVTLNVVSDKGCFGQHLHPVKIHYAPVSIFTFDTACALTPTTFTNSSISMQSDIAVTNWLFDQTSSDSSYSANYIFTHAGIHTASLVVITDEGCSDTSWANIKVWELPQPAFTAMPREGCQPLQVMFTDSSQSLDGTIIHWYWTLGQGINSPNKEPSVLYTEAGLYDITLEVTTEFGCKKAYTSVDLINVYPLPVAQFSFENSHPDILTPFVNIIDESIRGYIWRYDLGDNTTSNEQNPSHKYPVEGKYEIEQIVETEFGCLDTSYKTIEVNTVSTLYIPNSFTPNDDGVNDEFQAIGIGIREFDMIIYNRWGDRIYTSDNINMRWDGKFNSEPVKEDTYFYIVNAKDIFNKQHYLTGQVTVVY